MHHVCNKYHYVQEINSSNMPLKKNTFVVLQIQSQRFFYGIRVTSVTIIKVLRLFLKKAPRTYMGCTPGGTAPEDIAPGDTATGYTTSGSTAT